MSQEASDDFSPQTEEGLPLEGASNDVQADDDASREETDDEKLFSDAQPENDYPAYSAVQSEASDAEYAMPSEAEEDDDAVPSGGGFNDDAGEECESSYSDDSDLDDFIASDDEMGADEETMAKVSTAVQTTMQCLFPGIEKVIGEQDIRNEETAAKEKAAKEASDTAMAALESHVDSTLEAPRRLALAMAGHCRLGANSKFAELVGHLDVMLMITQDAGKYAVKEY